MYYSLDHEIMMNEGMCVRKDKVKEKVWDRMSIKTVQCTLKYLLRINTLKKSD